MKTWMSIFVYLFCISVGLGQNSPIRVSEYFEKQREDDITFRGAKKISLITPIPNVGRQTMTGSLALDQLQSGQTGKLTYWQFKVVSVVDNTNVILICGSKTRIWLEGYPTNDLTDGQTVFIIDYVEIVGTKTYETVLGAKSTIRHVRLLPVSESMKRIQDDLNRNPIESPDSGFRIWKLKKNKSVDGKFVKLTKLNVHIVKKDGKPATISFSDLSESDRLIVKQLQAAVDARAMTKKDRLSSDSRSLDNEAKDQSSLSRALDPNDTRRKWINTAYQSVIVFKNPETWIETDDASRKIKFQMKYVGHSNEFVELFNPDRNDQLRLFEDHMEVKMQNGWTSIGAGRWER